MQVAYFNRGKYSFKAIRENIILAKISEFTVIADAQENENAIMVEDYVVNIYIDGSATFPPLIWADLDNNSQRTCIMESCESSNPNW